MHGALPRTSRLRIADLAVALDREDEPMAATWRVVGDSAAKLGLPRPSYPYVRRLVLAERRRRLLRRERNAVLKQAASTFAAGRVPGFDYTVGRLLDAQAALAAEQARGSETRGSAGGQRMRSAG